MKEGLNCEEGARLPVRELLLLDVTAEPLVAKSTALLLLLLLLLLSLKMQES